MGELFSNVNDPEQKKNDETDDNVQSSVNVIQKIPNNKQKSRWFECGKLMKIKGNIVEFNGSTNEFNTVYGSQIVSSGTHIWKIKIIKMPYCVKIGIASEINQCNAQFDASKNSYNVAYSDSGKKVNNYNTHYTKYGDWYGEGDIITVVLNMRYNHILFKKNDKNQGVAFNNIHQADYRLAVCMGCYGGCVKMMSYVKE
eukprot:59245_1